MLMIFPTLFDNYKVLGYEVIFLVAKHQNLGPAELKISWREDVGFGCRIALLDVFILKCVYFGAELCL